MREWQDELAADPELAAALPAAHEAYLATRDARDVLPTRDDRRRHARPGQVPARAGAHALAAGPGVNPLGDRAVAEMGEWWAAGPCAQPDGGRRVTPGRRRSTAAPTRSGCSSPTCPPTGAHTDLLRRMEIVRLGQGVDATGRLAPEAIERTRVVLAEYAAAGPRARRRARCGWWRPAPPGTPPTAPTSWTMVARHARASCPRSSPGARRRSCPSSARPPRWTPRPGARRAAAPAAVPGRRHRRRLDRVRARRRRRRCGPPGRWTSAACG